MSSIYQFLIDIHLGDLRREDILDIIKGKAGSIVAVGVAVHLTIPQLVHYRKVTWVTNRKR